MALLFYFNKDLTEVRDEQRKDIWTRFCNLSGYFVSKSVVLGRNSKFRKSKDRFETVVTVLFFCRREWASLHQDSAVVSSRMRQFWAFGSKPAQPSANFRGLVLGLNNMDFSETLVVITIWFTSQGFAYSRLLLKLYTLNPFWRIGSIRLSQEFSAILCRFSDYVGNFMNIRWFVRKDSQEFCDVRRLVEPADSGWGGLAELPSGQVSLCQARPVASGHPSPTVTGRVESGRVGSSRN